MRLRFELQRKRIKISVIRKNLLATTARLVVAKAEEIVERPH
jgi:hypothetical protein